MLVLSRKTNQEIIIPGLSIVLKVLDTSHSRVKLGINAPPFVDILRAEAFFRAASQSPILIDSEHYETVGLSS